MVGVLRAACSGCRCHKLQSVDQQIAPGVAIAGASAGTGTGGHGTRRGRRGAVQAIGIVALSKHLGYERLGEPLLLRQVRRRLLLPKLGLLLMRRMVVQEGRTAGVVRWRRWWRHTQLVGSPRRGIHSAHRARPGGIAGFRAGKRWRGHIYGRRHAAGTGVRRQLAGGLSVGIAAGAGERFPSGVLPPPLIGRRQI